MVERAELIGRIPSTHFAGLSYLHSFGLTQNYIVFLECALTFDLLTYLKNLYWNLPFSHSCIMKKDFKTRIHIMNRETGEIKQQKLLTDPLFVFHHINAYEKEDTNEIICDVCAYDPEYFDVKRFLRKDMFTETLLNSDIVKSVAKRITIPLDTNSTEEVYCQIKDINKDAPFELPNINYSEYNTRPYKFMYGANTFYKKPFSIVKINVETGESIEKKYEDEQGGEYLPNEPVFVKNPDGQDEDDGVLLIMVLCNKRDFLSVLDAKDLREIARAEVPEDVRGSFTFHGFFADTQHFPKLNQ